MASLGLCLPSTSKKASRYQPCAWERGGAPHLGGDEGFRALLGEGHHLPGLVLEHQRAAHEVRLYDVCLHAATSARSKGGLHAIAMSSTIFGPHVVCQCWHAPLDIVLEDCATASVRYVASLKL